MKIPVQVHRGVACPPEYQQRSEADVVAGIRGIKSRLGSDLVILGHHYQCDPIVSLSDFTGDSFKLSRDAAGASGKYIVFCGVRFMAESARILARPDQIVIHPEETAGCPMADMAEIAAVKSAWDCLTRLNPDRKIIPVTYMNSSAEIKAFCGANGGSVCTSSNAVRVFEWARRQGGMIFFLPDEHLGRNTAHEMGFDPQDTLIWNAEYAEAHLRDPRYARAKLVVWKGFCYVHTRFRIEHVEKIRAQYPDAHIIVHPECPREVVAASDSWASTEGIVRRVREAPAGATIAIGTEINLVQRLARQHPDKTIVPLDYSFCLNMAKITPGSVLWALDHLGRIGVVEVDASISGNARKALRTMLEIGS